MQGALCQLIPLLHHSRWNWKHWKFICIAMNVFEAKPFCTHIDMWSARNDYKNTIITFGNSWTIECESMAFSNCYYSTSSTNHSLPFFRIVSFQEKWSYLCCYHERQLNNCLCPYKEWRTLSILFLYKHLCCVLFAVCVGNNTQFSKPDGNMVSRQHHH